MCSLYWEGTNVKSFAIAIERKCSSIFPATGVVHIILSGLLHATAAGNSFITTARTAVHGWITATRTAPVAAVRSAGPILVDQITVTARPGIPPSTATPGRKKAIPGRSYSFHYSLLVSWHLSSLTRAVQVQPGTALRTPLYRPANPAHHTQKGSL